MKKQVITIRHKIISLPCTTDHLIRHEKHRKLDSSSWPGGPRSSLVVASGAIMQTDLMTSIIAPEAPQSLLVGASGAIMMAQG